MSPLTPQPEIDRRRFLQIMGASLALAGIGGCKLKPAERIVPYNDPPDTVIPGKPVFYATTMSPRGYSEGILVETHEGRPTKIEGNPRHTANLGGTDPFLQAAILSLYDPARSQAVYSENEASDWDAFLKYVQVEMAKWRRDRGRGVVFLSEPLNSPTVLDERAALLQALPEAKWFEFTPLNHDLRDEGLRLAFGEVLQPVYHFDQADVVLSLDGSFLSEGAAPLRNARHFIDRRRVRAGRADMNRLYALETSPSLTGALADHRLALRSFEIEAIARQIAQKLGVTGIDVAESPEHGEWIAAATGDLKAHSGRALVYCGLTASAELQALAWAMNAELGALGRTVTFTAPLRPPAPPLGDLLSALDQGRVDTIFLLGGNPVYNMPADLNFAERVRKARVRVRLGEYEDETSALCHWHLPEANFLEAWGDALAFDGSASVQQPVCAPFYQGKSLIELLILFSNTPGQSALDRVRETWRRRFPNLANFNEEWAKWLQEGVILDMSASSVVPRLQSLKLSALPPAPHPDRFELYFKADPSVHDGRFANNSWLQELPKPLSKITWSNAIELAPETAARFELSDGDELELIYERRRIKGPVFILHGHAPESLTVTFGYGRTLHGAPVTEGLGLNAYLLQSAASPFVARDVAIRKTGVKIALASTQHHFTLEGRDLVRHGTARAFARDPKEIVPPNPAPDVFEKRPANVGAAWAMVIDLNACIGCNACMIACQAENNIPVVGRDEVLRTRSMHWIRIDRYHETKPGGELETFFEPVPCMHCETAPCEEVCPTVATNHSHQGLNQMIYNRCVGTRFCSNNCPYKVRRFNFYQYSDMHSPLAQMSRNPEVTVRSRGVMEKCTYCVQRIERAQIEAGVEERTLQDGDVVTACQGACPTRAIIFGDLNDPSSEVARLKKEPLNYGLLAHLGTLPRTTYLAKLKNPNPALERT